MDFFVRFLRGVCPTQRGVSHETEANRANLCLVVDCFRGEIHQYREAGPPERPQPEARRPLAQNRPPPAPQTKSRPSKTEFIIPLCLPHEHGLGDESLRGSIAVSASLLAAWGFGAAPAHPSDPKSDSFLSDTGKTSLPLTAALRGGSAPSLASLVAHGYFLTLCVI